MPSVTDITNALSQALLAQTKGPKVKVEVTASDNNPLNQAIIAANDKFQLKMLNKPVEKDIFNKEITEKQMDSPEFKYFEKTILDKSELFNQRYSAHKDNKTGKWVWAPSNPWGVTPEAYVNYYNKIKKDPNVDVDYYNKLVLDGNAQEPIVGYYKFNGKRQHGPIEQPYNPQLKKDLRPVAVHKISPVINQGFNPYLAASIGSIIYLHGLKKMKGEKKPGIFPLAIDKINEKYFPINIKNFSNTNNTDQYKIDFINKMKQLILLKYSKYNTENKSIDTIQNDFAKTFNGVVFTHEKDQGHKDRVKYLNEAMKH